MKKTVIKILSPVLAIIVVFSMFKVGVLADNISTIPGIAMLTNPTITSYTSGQSLDLTGAKIIVSHKDGTQQVVPITANMISNFNTNVVGQQTITVSYAGETTQFSVEIYADSNADFKLSKSVAYMNLEKLQSISLRSLVNGKAVNNSTWTSSNPSVANVDNNGNIFAITKGITVIYAQNGPCIDSCVVSVSSEAVPRLGGETRYETSVAIASQGWTNSQTVYLAPASTFNNSIAAASLASLNNSPILLTGNTSVPPSVMHEITSLAPKKIVLLGNSSDISDSEMSSLKKSFPQAAISRISGATLYDTAENIAQNAVSVAKQKNITVDTVAVCNDTIFADALSIAELAAQNHWVVLFSSQSSLSTATTNEISVINPKNIYIIGGENAISTSVEQQLYKLADSVVRISGADRYATSAAVLSKFATSFSNGIAYASGTNFPDALACAPLAAMLKMLIVIVDPKKGANTAQKQYISKVLSPKAYVFGGIAALPNSVVGANTPAITPKNFTLPLSTSKLCEQQFSLSGTSSKNATYHIDNGSPSTSVVKNGAFKINFDTVSLAKGWHNIYVDTSDSKGRVTEQVICINVVGDNFPSVLIPQTIVNKGLKELNTICTDYRGRLLSTYSSTGNFFDPNLEIFPCPYTPSSHSYDSNGIPLAKINGVYVYDPVTIVQCALSNYSVGLTKGDYKTFLKIVDWLVQYQSSNGCFPYNFDYRWDCGYGVVITKKSGWYTAMAQGEMLSALERAYYLTKDTKYLAAGQKCLNFMAQSNCVSSLTDFTKNSPLLSIYQNDSFVNEIPYSPQPFILNGGLFGTMGLYDWSTLAGVVPIDYGFTQAKSLFYASCRSIAVTLPYFDTDGYTCYDLTPFTFSNGYVKQPNFGSSYQHGCDIAVLSALYQITGVQEFNTYATTWKSYYDNRKK